MIIMFVVIVATNTKEVVLEVYMVCAVEHNKNVRHSTFPIT